MAFFSGKYIQYHIFWSNNNSEDINMYFLFLLFFDSYVTIPLQFFNIRETLFSLTNFNKNKFFAE